MKNKTLSISAPFVHVKHLMDSLEMIERISGRKGPIAGLSTGFVELDTMTSGLHSSGIIVVAGRPSSGKTSLCLNIAEHVSIENKRPVGVFSLEMSGEQLMGRLLCSQAAVDAAAIRTGFLSVEEQARLSRAKDRLAGANLFIDDTPLISVAEMRAKARRLKAQQGDLGLIIVDYMQLIGEYSDAEGDAQATLKICYSLKALATELNVPVMVISQLNRAVEERRNKRPVMTDLNHYGLIERVADIALFVYREEIYKKRKDNRGEAEIIITKNRNGPIGTVRLTFLSRFTKFANREQEERKAATSQ